ncbi:MAG: SWIM zinc finger family protein [Chloroflexota bacterium]
MDYGMIGKIEKAKRYAQEPQRITLRSLEVEFKGDNNTYALTLNDHGWHCSCPGYGQHKICPHIMTIERLLRPMLKREPVPYASGQNVVSDVEKVKRYSEETDRIRFLALDASFEGSNSTHEFTYQNNAWNCNCDFFKSRGVCCHTMAMGRMLTGMLPAVVTSTSVVSVT